jgi:phenylacetate-coenzyme A ligase PaaK-like adenylate-forming protein
LIPSEEIFSIASSKQFDKIALQIFRYQYDNNLVYKKYCELLNVNKATVKTTQSIPFLPIQFFKTHHIITGSLMAQETFTSSGTTGAITSKHLVTDIKLYEKSYQTAFSQFYGAAEDYVILALLPSYLEREGSSLIYMFRDLINTTKNPESGFYLNDYATLITKIIGLHKQQKNVILLGVTYALLDLIDYAKANELSLSESGSSLIVMETGGMKGKRQEMIRQELHEELCQGLGVSQIHSEYGMTELLSQAYSFGNGIFECPNWMQVYIREPEDALSYVENGKTGGINIIDLANINSCSFIATQDLGKKYDNQTFEVLGRFDHSDIRGCNLMVM